MSPEGKVPPTRSFEDEAFAVTAEAYARQSGDWEQAVQAALARLFAFLADHPDRTNACIVGDYGIGEAALDRRDGTIDRFAAFLREGFERAGAPPPVIAEAIGGGVYEIVRGHVLERRLEQLPAAIPEATVVALSPFVGPARAQELGRAENVQVTS
jgi:hypothetical protein